MLNSFFFPDGCSILTYSKLETKIGKIGSKFRNQIIQFKINCFVMFFLKVYINMKCVLCKKQLNVKNPTTEQLDVTVCHVICLERARKIRRLNLEWYFFNELTNF